MNYSVSLSLLTPSAFLLSERERERGGGGRGSGCGKRDRGEGVAVILNGQLWHWQDKIRIDSLITASLQKQQRQRERY